MTKKQVSMICLINRLSSVIREENYTKGFFTMKKNTMMRVATVLMVAVLLTTCAISGTFAKYVSEASASDTARVAKWGWGTTSVAIDLFDDVYGDTVDSSDGANVIAPGTSKTSAITWTPDATFAPEVDYALTFTAAGTIPAEIEQELDWTLSVNGATETKYTTFAQLVAALEAVKYDGDASAAAPTVNVVIGWVWVFNGGDDAADTALGNMGTLPELTITVTMTATQVD